MGIENTEKTGTIKFMKTIINKILTMQKRNNTTIIILFNIIFLFSNCSEIITQLPSTEPDSNEVPEEYTTDEEDTPSDEKNRRPDIVVPRDEYGNPIPPRSDGGPCIGNLLHLKYNCDRIPDWLYSANGNGYDKVEVQRDGYVIWYRGIFRGDWEDGLWKNGSFFHGTWKNGVWEGGVWEGGVWRDGIWKRGDWCGGEWFNGTWKNGKWGSGIWHDGNWEAGSWQNGIFKDGVWENGSWHYGEWREEAEWRSGKCYYEWARAHQSSNPPTEPPCNTELFENNAFEPYRGCNYF